MAALSEARLAANRRNAKKSTGPRTAAGKKRSSQNARKHGLFARHLIPDRRSPSSQSFQAMFRDFCLDFAPTTPLERLWVERLTLSTWRVQRAYRLEAHAAERSDKADSPLPAINCLPKLVRYENMIDRQFHQAVEALNKNKAATRCR